MPGTTYNIKIVLATNARDAGRDLGDLGDRARGAGHGLGEAGDQAKGTGKSLASLGGLAREAAANFAGYLSAQAVFAGLSKAVKFAEDTILGFDDAMTQSVAIMGNVSDATRKSMEGTARDVAVKYNEAVADTAKGYYFLASAGYSAADSQLALGQVTAFAKAGMIDVERATELAADAQNAMGLKTDDAGENLVQLTRITDVLTKANVDANGSVEQFGAALTNKAAAGARLANVSLESTVAVLEAFASQGLKGKKAGEAFSIVLRDLQEKARTNADQFAALGITVFDAQGGFAGFPTIIGQLEKSLSGMSVEQANATLATLGFTVEGSNYIKTLLGMSGEIVKYEEKLKSAGGVTQQIAEKQMTSMVEQLKHLRSVAAELSLVGFEKMVAALSWLSERFGPTLGNVADALKSAAEFVRPLAEGLAMIAGGTVVAGLMAMAAALNATTGFLREHEGIVQALATVGLVMLVARLAQAGAAFASLAADKAAFMLFEFAGKVDGAVAGVNAVIAAFTSARAAGAGFSGAIGVAGATLSGLVGTAALTVGGLAVLGLAIYGVMTKLKEGEQAAEDFNKGIAQRYDLSSLQGLRDAIDETKKKVDDLGQVGSTIGERFNIPEMIKAEGEYNKLNDTVKDMTKTLEDREHVFWDTAKAIEAAQDPALRTTDSLNQIHDSLDRIATQEKLDVVSPEGAKKLFDLGVAANITSPAVLSLKDAFAQVAEAGSTAEDALKAYKTALDALFGVHIAAQQAENTFAASLDTVHGKVGAGIDLMDAYNAKNREARDAVLSAADAALNHAVSIYEESGSLGQANATLGQHREQLIQAMQQTGMSRQAAEQYIATLKLTPENILTLAQLNKDQAEGAANQLIGQLNDVARPRTASVYLDVSQAEAQLNRLGVRLNDLERSTIAANANYDTGLRAHADGGVVLHQYAGGGVENHVAQISPAGAMRLWAEPETGGEAYIPLGAGKRQRSLETLEAVAGMFGYSLMRFAQGGLTGLSGGSSGPGIMVGPGAIQVQVYNPSSGVDVEQAVDRALNRFTRNMRTEARTRRHALPGAMV